MNYYRKPINKVVDNVKLKMQLGALTLKISENNNKIDDLIEVDKNINSKISSDVNELSNIKNDILTQIESDIFDKRYTVKNISFNNKDLYLLFETKTSHNFTNKGILKINSKFNYNNLNSKIPHEYKFYNQKGVLFYNKILDHDNGIIKEKFVVNCQNIDKLTIKLLLINKEKYNVDLYKYNYIDIIHNDNINTSLININESNISSNLEKIGTNKNSISSNLGKIEEHKGNISSNLTKITDYENNISSNLTKITDNENNISSNLTKITDNESSTSSNLINMKLNEDNIAINLTRIKELNQNKAYLKNLENILFYDKKTQVEFKGISFEKIFKVNAKQNYLIELSFNKLKLYFNKLKYY